MVLLILRFHLKIRLHPYSCQKRNNNHLIHKYQALHNVDDTKHDILILHPKHILHQIFQMPGMSLLRLYF